MDSPREIRDGEEFALETLKTYLSENNINANDLSIKQFPSGYSNLTYFLKSSSQELFYEDHHLVQRAYRVAMICLESTMY